MSEINRPANTPKAATELALTEIRRLWQLSPEMLREMAERTEHTKKLVLGPAEGLLGKEKRSNQS
jgi:hypothetical protein